MRNWRYQTKEFPCPYCDCESIYFNVSAKVWPQNEKGRETARTSSPCAEISSRPQLERAVQQTGLSAEAAAAAFTEASAASAIVVVIVVVISSESVRAEHGDKTDQPRVVKEIIRVVRIPIPVPVVISTVTHNQFLQLFHCGGFPIRTTSYVGGCRNVSNLSGLFFRLQVPRSESVPIEMPKDFAPPRSGRKNAGRRPIIPADLQES